MSLSVLLAIGLDGVLRIRFDSYPIYVYYSSYDCLHVFRLLIFLISTIAYISSRSLIASRSFNVAFYMTTQEQDSEQPQHEQDSLQ
jgi:hypothetical protein